MIFCQRASEEEIKVEQLYESIIPQMLKEIPSLAKELNKFNKIEKIYYSEKYLGGKQEFLIEENNGYITIIRNCN